MNFFYRLFIFSALIVALHTIGLEKSFAQNSAGITLVPATIEEPADPGAVLARSLKVTNESTEEKEYFVYKRNIKGVETGGVPIFAEEDAERTGYEMSEWIFIESEKVVVPAGATVEIPILITVPENATPGSHFAGVFVSVEAPRLREIGAGVGYEVASIISIRISGDVIDNARIRSFSTDKLLYGEKNVSFTARIENQGNILIRPRGPLTVRSMFGKSETIMINESLAGVFPQTTRDLNFSWSSEGLGFGKYEAVLALSYDGNGGQKTIDSTLVFWVFPTKVMLSVLGAFVLIFVIGYMFTQHYIRRAVMRASGSRRITSTRHRRQVGVSRFAFVFVWVLTVLVIFFIIILMFFA